MKFFHQKLAIAQWNNLYICAMFGRESAIFFLGNFLKWFGKLMIGVLLMVHSQHLSSKPLEPTVDSISMGQEWRKMALDSIRESKYFGAEKILLKVLGIARRHDDYKLTKSALNNLAECYSSTGRTDLAMETYLQLLQKVTEKSDTNAMTVVLVNLGDEYTKRGQYQQAIEAELEAIRLKELSKNYKELAYFYQKLGELFTADLEKWEFYVNKALGLSRTPEYSNWYTDIAIYNDLGFLWSKKGDYAKAEAFYDTMYRLSVEADYPRGINTAASERALMLYQQGRYAEAVPLVRHNYEIYKTEESDYSFVYASNLLAANLIKIHETSEAIEILKESLLRSRKATLMPEAARSLQLLAEAYEESGQWQSAFHYQASWFALKDSLDGVEIHNTMNALQTQFETGKKQQLIDRLNEQAIIEKSRNQMLLGLLALALVAVFLLIFILRLRNRTIKQNLVLHEQEQKILKLENEKLSDHLDYKTRELTTATLHLINKNEVLNELREQLIPQNSLQPDWQQVVQKIDQNINLDGDWNNFSKHFSEVHPQFFASLKSKFPGLTPNEERLCAYLRINLNTKEISNMLNVTTAAVDKSRNRLRKKLEIGSEVNLTDFLGSL